MSEIGNGKYATFVDGTESADTIDNNNFKVTIRAGAGNDLIRNHGSYFTSGDDYLFSRRGDDASINAGTGNDSITNQGDKAILLGDDGNDSIDNRGSSSGDGVTWYCGRAVTIDGGKGNDYITNGGINVTINSGAGKDTLNVMGSTTTVTAGKGNDIISIGSAGASVEGLTLESDAKTT